MPDSLIINARHQMRWHQRLCSDASTAMLWGMWLWLWRPAISAVSWLGSMGSSLQPALMKIMANGSAVHFESSMVALVGTSSTLLLWNMLPSRKAKMPPVHTLRDYASHFDLAERDIISGRASSICVVHHDEHGRIIRIDART
jgi:poly-beta-1,6-N-acetyl-D-glucosamine biosynthesis protein PgaD